MRLWLVEAVREYLSSVSTTWERDEEFSRNRPGIDIWVRKTPDRKTARLQFYVAKGERPAITPEANLIAFCRQMDDMEVRILMRGLALLPSITARRPRLLVRESLPVSCLDG